MCGRIFLNEQTLKRIMIDFPNQKVYESVQPGELFPTDICLVYTKEGLKAMKWGVQPEWSKQIIINARQETVLEKEYFKDDFCYHRCVVIVSGFFEWKTEGKKKTKYVVTMENTELFYLAGFYKKEKDQEGFIILTQEATEEFKEIHNRLPLILSKEEVINYVNQRVSVDYTKSKNPVLKFLPEVDWKVEEE